MAKGNDRDHFEDYREQTAVKHEILAAYLPAYFHILKAGNKNLNFCDGFAGRGTYTTAATGETVDGSPLRALKLIADNKDLSDKVSTIFIEADEVLFAQLNETVTSFYANHQDIRGPTCLEGKFADRVKEVLDLVKGELAPTFLFVDPCGVSGTSFETIRAVMDCDKCEAFVFFNIDGVRRIAGLEKRSPVLVELLGSEARADALYDSLGKTHPDAVAEREELILSHYRQALREDMGATYTVEFRVEHEDKRKTSHYLIHATKHHLGFAIMKDVMWRRGHAEDSAGALEFAQASRTSFIPLFSRGDTIKRDIAAALKAGPMRVDTFFKDWVYRPEDPYCTSAYKAALVEMEAAGSIQVLGKDGQTPAPAEMRPKRKGKTTLGEGYYVRLNPGK